MFRLYQTVIDDPYINLSIEAQLFREKKKTVFLWRNRPCVIAGRNQNLYTEADLSFAERNGILPVRRTTGGGCVYHDHGNLNYSFILPQEELDRAPQMILQILSLVNIEAEVSGRNDLMINGRKLGGTAWQSEDEWVLFHGTLLIDTDLEKMRHVLTPAKIKLASKGIASVRSRVINLKEVCSSLTAEMICGACEQFFGCKAMNIEPDERIIKEAEKLRSEKWIFGECADYQAEHDFKTDQGIMRVCLSVHDGVISGVTLSHDFMDAAFMPDMEPLKGMLYNPDEIYAKISALMRGKGLNVHI